MQFLKAKFKAKGRSVLLASVVASFGITGGALYALPAVASSSAPPSQTSLPSITTNPPASAGGLVVIGSVEAIRTPDQINLPVDEYRLASANVNTVLRGQVKAMGACMSRFGFDYSRQVSASQTPTVFHDYDRLFGLVDSQVAEDWGYHGTETMAADGSSQTLAMGPGMSQTELLVAMGGGSSEQVNGLQVPRGGCIEEARLRGGDPEFATGLLERTIGFGLAQSNSDPIVLDAFAAWSHCMKGKGFDYATPMDAINDPKWTTPTPTAQEIATAVSDVSCKQATNLTGIRVAVASAWQKKYIADHASDFKAVIVGNGAQLALAKKELN